MNIYNAIMRAADHIEKNPRCYNFHLGDPPKGDDGQGCALAWIGHFAGIKSAEYLSFAKGLYACQVGECLTGKFDVGEFFHRAGIGISQVDSVPRVLRAYAEKFHALPKAEQDAFKPWLAELMRKVEGAQIAGETEAEPSHG